MSIEVRNIRKTFGDFRALRGVSLRVDNGELVALLGPSGSGKTTLLRIIAGLEAPDECDDCAVLFHEQDVTRSRIDQRRVGFVFQHYALFRNMTVFQNIAFGLEVRPRKLRPSRAEIRDKVEQLLKLIHLEGLAGRYPAQLSGGQRQRVALARALAIEPKVLLLDEPFGALDAKVRHGLRRWLRRLHDEIHVTSILVTHDQDEALEVADRVVVMNEGKVEQDGTPEEVFHSPKTEFVMDFLGNVNLFHGRVESGKAVFGPLVIDPPSAPGGHPEGRAARLLVRPYDLDIHPRANGTPSIGARVKRIQSAGAQVRVELEAETGEMIQVEMTHSRYREMGLRPDEQVYCSPRDAKLFLGEGI